jgi:HK97 family phage prohead protease
MRTAFKLERRRASGPCHLCVERRASQGSGKVQVLRGYALVYGSPSELIPPGFIETIRTGAAAYTIKNGTDTRALVDHIPHLILGRRSAGTLRMKDDKTGLKVEIDPPDTSIGRDIVESIRRKDINQMSFGFETLEDEWPSQYRRELISVNVFDVSVVTFPAYPDTTITAGARHNRLAEMRLRLAEALATSR